MYHGKYQGQHLTQKQTPKFNKKAGTMFLSLLVLLTMAVGGTIAWLTDDDAPITNTFTPSTVDCEVTEDFDGEVKENVNVTNTGNTDAYIRVKLVTYRVNEAGQQIGGIAEVPEFTPGANWVKFGEFYYYTLPVAPNEKPATDLIDSIALTESYNDADGGKQVIEVMAEAIQSGPANAVGQSWGVSISQGSVTAYNAG